MTPYCAHNNLIQIYHLHEALLAAGCSDLDCVFAQDDALMHWLDGRKFQVLEFCADGYGQTLDQAAAQGIEIVIIKEK